MRIARFIARFVKQYSIRALSLYVMIAILVAHPVVHGAEQHEGSQQEAQLTRADVQPHHIKISKLSDYIQRKFKLAERKATNIVTAAFRNAARYEDLEPELILAVIAVESTFKEKVVSPNGARGLMQVLPQAHPQKVRAVGGVNALFDPVANISTGATILASCLEDSDGDLREALSRYNGSSGRSGKRYAEKVLRIYRDMRI
jgi:soluble lytic murein transglycosylase-like protein